jgi:ubiquinone/menaquinone biosynthesis C-methylase UbiE
VNARVFYDAIAVEYAELFGVELSAYPWDRAFLDIVAALATGPVLDVGCGPGRVTGYLRDRGLDVSGVDPSPGMLAVARATHPDLTFTEGSMLALDVPDGSFGAVVAWYSTIHVTDAELPGAIAEFRRVLSPGGHLALAFQVGDEPLRVAEPFGKPVTLEFHRRQPDAVTAMLESAGFEVRTRMVREPEENERVPQAYLLARGPAAG